MGDEDRDGGGGGMCAAGRRGTAAALSFDVTPQDAATAGTAPKKIYHVGNGETPPVLTYSVMPNSRRKRCDSIASSPAHWMASQWRLRSQSR
jgi:hypothetical protein